MTRLLSLTALCIVITATFFIETTSAQTPPDQMPPFTPGDFARGDANGDGLFDLADPLFTLNYLYQDGEEPGCLAAADANDDEGIDISDATAALFALFAGGRLPEPWPAPGQDPTPGIGCREPGPSPQGEGDQIAPEPEDPRDGESYVRLEIEIGSEGLQIVGARVLAGGLPITESVAGDHIYEVCDVQSGRCLAVGSLEDPRELRGLRREARGEEEDDHLFEQLPEGRFTVVFPNENLSEDNLLGLQVRLYRRTALGADLDVINVELMDQLRQRVLELVGETLRGDVAILLFPALKDFNAGLFFVPSIPFTTVTPLLINGSSGSKKNLVIIGDGFNAADQDEYNQLVDELVMEGAFGHDLFMEAASAFNIYRINAISADSGVTRMTPTQFRTNSIPDTGSQNLAEGNIIVDVHGVGIIIVPVSGASRSLNQVFTALKNVSWNRTNSCGDFKQYALKLRMVGGGSSGYIKIGSPSGLPGDAGDFDISFVPNPDPPNGIELSFIQNSGAMFTPKSTALNYIYTGNWDYCWMHGSCDSTARINDTLSLVPGADFVVIILNQTGPGGCGGGGRQVFTKSVSWGTVAHELGHGIGGLGDEYLKTRKYTGDRPTSPNLDNITDRDMIKWADFIAPTTPLATELADVGDSNFDCGAFEGGGTYNEDIYRPVSNCRMKSSSGNTEYCPVCYTHIRELLYPNQGLTFTRTYTGDFDGDGKDDLVQHKGTMLALFISDGTKLKNPTYVATARIASGWQIKSHDRYYVADFNNDGKDDLYVFNGVNWSTEYLGCLRSTGDGFVMTARYDDTMNGWDFKSQDEFYVADFNNDGKDDLYVFNGKNWGPEYLAMLRSNGGSLTNVRRYDDSIPGWDMNNNDRFFVGDQNGDGREDLYVQNTLDWGPLYVGMLRSAGSTLNTVKRYTDSLPGWEMDRQDRILVGDFNGDNKDDLCVFNGLDWGTVYLGMFSSSGDQVNFIKLYDSSPETDTPALPGWQLRSNDRFHVADLDGDGRDDLYAHNVLDWVGSNYIGLLRSTGSGFSGTYVEDFVGRWNLGDSDTLLVGDHNGDGKDDLFIRNSTWLGLLRSTETSLSFKRHYYHWIHNFLYHGPLGHSDGLIIEF